MYPKYQSIKKKFTPYIFKISIIEEYLPNINIKPSTVNH